MLVSFRYAASAAQFGLVPGVIARPEEVNFLERWGEFWYRWVSAAFVGGYLGEAKPGKLMQSDVDVLRCHPVTEEYDAVLAGLQRRGFRLELSADDESVERVTSPGGNTLDHPSLAELRHLLRGISIRSLTQQRDNAT